MISSIARLYCLTSVQSCMWRRRTSCLRSELSREWSSCFVDTCCGNASGSSDIQACPSWSPPPVHCLDARFRVFLPVYCRLLWNNILCWIIYFLILQKELSWYVFFQLLLILEMRLNNGWAVWSPYTLGCKTAFCRSLLLCTTVDLSART